eukprot:Rhum_TRINITY_DN13199_c2_g1::Rhum_TRINITY_DN13199_c2_g1_i1::g.57839::m.57839
MPLRVQRRPQLGRRSPEHVSEGNARRRGGGGPCVRLLPPPLRAARAVRRQNVVVGEEGCSARLGGAGLACVFAVAREVRRARRRKTPAAAAADTTTSSSTPSAQRRRSPVARRRHPHAALNAALVQQPLQPRRQLSRRLRTAGAGAGTTAAAADEGSRGSRLLRRRRLHLCRRQLAPPRPAQRCALRLLLRLLLRHRHRRKRRRRRRLLRGGVARHQRVDGGLGCGARRRHAAEETYGQAVEPRQPRRPARRLGPRLRGGEPTRRLRGACRRRGGGRCGLVGVGDNRGQEKVEDAAAVLQRRQLRPQHLLEEVDVCVREPLRACKEAQRSKGVQALVLEENACRRPAAGAASAAAARNRVHGALRAVAIVAGTAVVTEGGHDLLVGQRAGHASSFL